jgi:hypothetical protein
LRNDDIKFGMHVYHPSHPSSKALIWGWADTKQRGI